MAFNCIINRSFRLFICLYLSIKRWGLYCWKSIMVLHHPFFLIWCFTVVIQFIPGTFHFLTEPGFFCCVNLDETTFWKTLYHDRVNQRQILHCTQLKFNQIIVQLYLWHNSTRKLRKIALAIPSLLVSHPQPQLFPWKEQELHGHLDRSWQRKDPNNRCGFKSWLPQSFIEPCRACILPKGLNECI